MENPNLDDILTYLELASHYFYDGDVSLADIADLLDRKEGQFFIRLAAEIQKEKK